MSKRHFARYVFCAFAMFCITKLHAGYFESDSARGPLLHSEKTTVKSFREQLVNVVLQEHARWNVLTAARENDSLVTDILKAYWANLDVYVKASQLQDSLWQESNPWSAAFISWVMKQAGAGTSFRYAASHSEYIAVARNNVMKMEAGFKAYEVTDSLAAWPQPGDLLCKNRGGKSYTLGNIKKGCISHCDIVVDVDAAKRTVTTIGGNLNNRVAKRMVQLDERGLIDRNIVWCINDDPASEFAGGQEDFFAVIRVND